MDKDWYRSKTVQSAIAMALLALAQMFGLTIPNELYVIAGSFGLYGFRAAMK